MRGARMTTPTDSPGRADSSEPAIARQHVADLETALHTARRITVAVGIRWCDVG